MWLPRCLLSPGSWRLPRGRETAPLQQIRLGCHINAQNRGMITFKDVPVQWDVQPQ